MTEELAFYYGNDEFVNEAIADIAVQLAEDETLQINEEADRITICSESPVKAVRSLILDGANSLSTNTHRRSSIARYTQAEALDAAIKPVETPFPDEHPALGEEIGEKELTDRGIGIVDEIQGNIGQSIYTLSPSYTGDPIEFKTKRVRRYFDALEEKNSSHWKSEHKCKCCARDDLPNWKYDGENVEYNQQFTHYTTKSGFTPLGQKGSQDSNRRGRCVACLVAGFGYTLIKKPFYTGDGDYRIFVPDAPLDVLCEIRREYRSLLTEIDAELHDKNPRYKVLSSNLPLRVSSDEGQTLALLSTLIEKYSEKERTRFDPTKFTKQINAVLAYTSSNSKGGQPVRGITSIDRFELYDSLYEYVKPVSYENGLYRVNDLLAALSSTKAGESPGAHLTHGIKQFSLGILREKPSLVSEGLFQVAKQVINENLTGPQYIDIQGGKAFLSNLFDIMSMLSEDEIQAISNVGSSLGGLFHTRDDVSVLISLQNTNNLEQFVSALERAGMEGMKKSVVREEPISDYDLVWNEDLETTMEVLADEGRFDTAKSVLVSHASLSALYNNEQGDNNDE